MLPVEVVELEVPELQAHLQLVVPVVPASHHLFQEFLRFTAVVAVAVRTLCRLVLVVLAGEGMVRPVDILLPLAEVQQAQ
jgi:hypothetical protein